MAQYSALLNVMITAVRKAARGLKRDFGEIENLQVSLKGPSDFVSTADLNTEKTLLEELSKARPNYGFLMEEGGERTGKDSRNRWVIDPLDGTLNFLHGLPHFAISVALERDGQIHAGVIYDPIKEELFVAEKGAGAYYNDRRMRVSARRELDHALLATGIPFNGRPGHGEFITELDRLAPQIAGIRRFGAASLDLAYVAAGRYEAFWERGLSSWDMAAGIILVKEAGGTVSDLSGRENMLEGGDILAANENLHRPILEILKKAKA